MALSKRNWPGAWQTAKSKAIVAPVTLGDETIGALQLHQVAQTAENLCLFEEIRQQAGREQTVREITEKMRAAPNLDVLQETASRELGQSLGVRHNVLELGIEADRNAQLG